MGRSSLTTSPDSNTSPTNGRLERTPTVPPVGELPTLLSTLKPYLLALERDLTTRWAELAVRPEAVAELAMRFVQTELVVPLIEETDELRGQLYSGLVRQLVRMIHQAESVAVHSCDMPGQPDSFIAEQTCGACLLRRISAEVYVAPTVGKSEL